MRTIVEKRGRGRPVGSSRTANELHELKDMMTNLTKTLTQTNNRITLLEQHNIETSQNNNYTEIANTNNENTQITTTTNHTNMMTKLPQQQFPSFKGDIIEFESWQIFQYSVDSIRNSILPPASKLMYLLSCLEGTPKNMIKQLPIMDESYYKAKDILFREYGNTNFTIKALHQKLQTLPHCADSLTDIRNFTDQTEQILLHMQQSSYVDIFGILVIIERKLPKWVVEKLVSLELESPNLTVEQVINCMRNALRVKEMTEQANPQAHESNKTQLNSIIRRPFIL